ncbi:hypothetical protein ACHWQZ_G000650 [Mnemiopsis leidyi]
MTTNFLQLLVLASCQLQLAKGLGDITGLLTSAPQSHSNLTSGKLPTWLKGGLYRAGPGMFEHGGRSVDNLADGLAKIHGWTFRGDGTVQYSAVMIPSNIYNKTIDDKVLATVAQQVYQQLNETLYSNLVHASVQTETGGLTNTPSSGIEIDQVVQVDSFMLINSVGDIEAPSSLYGKGQQVDQSAHITRPIPCIDNFYSGAISDISSKDLSTGSDEIIDSQYETYSEAAPNTVVGKISPDLTTLEEIKLLALDSYDKKDNTNIAIWDLDGGKSVTVTAESPVSQQVSLNSLTYRGVALNDAIAKLSATQKVLFSATHYAKHVSGSSINYVLTMNLLPWELKEATYQFFEYIPDSSGELTTRKIGSISTPTTDLRLLHMFGATENFVVVPLWNYQIYPESLDTALHDFTHLCESLHFNYDVPLYFYVLSLSGERQYKFTLPPGRGVHIMNTFERTNRKGQVEVVMDAPTTTDVNGLDLSRSCLFDVMNIPYIKDPGYLYSFIPWNTTLRRYILNVNTTEYTIEDLPRTWEPLDSLIDFPFINPAYWGRDYCYCYFQQWQLSTNNMDLMKYDVCKNSSISWHEDNKHVMEPVFVANTKPTSEDDGVVMAPVYDSKDGSTELIVWDAKDLKVLARYDNLVKVPYTIHGLWFNDKNV